MKLMPLLTLAFAGSLVAQSYFIKGPESPKTYEAMAIKELTDYLAKRIDGKLTVGGASPVTFHVGDTELAARHQLLSDSLPDDEWHIKSVGDNVILNGGGTHANGARKNAWGRGGQVPVRRFIVSSGESVFGGNDRPVSRHTYPGFLDGAGLHGGQGSMGGIRRQSRGGLGWGLEVSSSWDGP